MHSFMEVLPEWLEKPSSHWDIILCSIINIHRNIPGYVFPEKLSPSMREQVTSNLVNKINKDFELDLITMHKSELAAIEEEVLKERQLIGISSENYSQVFINESQSFSIVLLEDDHFHGRLIIPGMDKEILSQESERITAIVDSKGFWIKDANLGYLTSRLDNVGLGIKLQIIVHLPGISLVKKINDFKQKWSNLKLRWGNLFNQGVVFGNIYKITFVQSLGISIEELLKNFCEFSEDLYNEERAARQIFLKEAEIQTENNVWRALGILENSRLISFDEATNLLSALRFGVSINLLENISISQCNKALFASFPGYVRRKHGPVARKEHEDYHRSNELRAILGKHIK
ncbi:MAG: hypothetical protein JXA60_05085 [Candidatus Coatesbacteria bacterium]|nr:hypothetical protein [Candidatus Coatesbacteria bacterium]